jgi:predicted nucleic acid-binding protein
LIPTSPILVEVNYWLIKLAGPDAWSSFVADIVRGAYRVIHPTETDIERAAELETEYLDLDLGCVDASVIVICERLGKKHVARSTDDTTQSYDRGTAHTSHSYPTEVERSSVAPQTLLACARRGWP